MNDMKTKQRSQNPTPKHSTALPLHPMLVHLPIAVWILVPITDLMYLLRHESFWWESGFWLLLVGTVAALPAIITGFMEAIPLEKTHPATDSVNRHMILMALTWIVFSSALIPHRGEHPTEKAMWLGFILSCSGAVLTVVGGHIGAKLVYQFGVGHRKNIQNTNDAINTGTTTGTETNGPS